MPRVLVNVKTISTTTKLIGSFPSSLPLYFTATALGKLAHPEGEVVGIGFEKARSLASG